MDPQLRHKILNWMLLWREDISIVAERDMRRILDQFPETKPNPEPTTLALENALGAVHARLCIKPAWTPSCEFDTPTTWSVSDNTYEHIEGTRRDCIKIIERALGRRKSEKEEFDEWNADATAFLERKFPTTPAQTGPEPPPVTYPCAPCKGRGWRPTKHQPYHLVECRECNGAGSTSHPKETAPCRS